MDPLTLLFKVATYAAGTQLRQIQQNKEQAAAARLAVREQVTPGAGSGPGESPRRP